MLSQNQYKTVQIQNLSPLKTSRVEKIDTLSKWKSKKCQHWDGKCKCAILCYKEARPANVYSHSNSFYGAFAEAYNNHEDVVLSPDDVWMVITLMFSKYINDNAELMRDKFVSHSGQKKLSVTTWNQTSESEWEEFFSLIIEEIKKNTKDNVVDLLRGKFSTTTEFEDFMSIATIMDSFQKYFSYGRCIPCCGIRNVKFMGTLDDWKNLQQKMIKLQSYAVSTYWTDYINQLNPIIEKFIDTFNGNVDVDWWNKVMNITHGRLGSGSTSYVSGWILNFFGIYSKVETYDIKSYSFDFPVEIDNRLTGVQKTVNIIGGFSGVTKEEEAYRPQMSYAVFWDGVQE